MNQFDTEKRAALISMAPMGIAVICLLIGILCLYYGISPCFTNHKGEIISGIIFTTLGVFFAVFSNRFSAAAPGMMKEAKNY